jgi:hypothetical protein
MTRSELRTFAAFWALMLVLSVLIYVLGGH